MTTTYLPQLDIATQALVEHKNFWRHCAARELRFQSCADCGLVRHPPAPCCARCRSRAIRWVEASDDAELFSYTVVHHAPFAAAQAALPYNVAIVEFPALDHMRLISNVIDAPADSLRIGMSLQLVWQEASPDRLLPLFRRRAAS